MQLPPGATGFDAGPVDLEAGLRELKAICHHAGRLVGARVGAARRAGVTPNFHTVELDQGGRRTAVLRHTVLPLLALAEGPVQFVPVFVDRPELAAALRQVCELTVLAVEALQAPLTAAHLRDLGRGELGQVSYWRPGTVGELLFNVWD